MEVILLENVRNLGKLGDKVDVKPGYGRNYLIPQGKVTPATKDSLAAFEQRRAELEKKAKETLEAAQQRAEQAEKVTVTIASRAGDEGKLYGSIGVREVAMAITEAGVEVKKREVNLPEGPIRSLGQHQVNLQLHPEVETTIALQVVDEKE